jgi:two-component system NtrC family sensor kinase
MAAGIAHEINNPLAIICEEAGLAKDLMDPQFGQKLTPEDMTRYLDAIQEAVFRCRDITRKLLGFVRKTDINLAQYDVNDIITNFLEGFLTRELTVSNIEILQKLEPQLPKINADKNQLEQVLLNIINNAVDAIQGSGKITIITSRQNQNVHISIIDTGIGMNREQMEKIFLPFYSTKEVGKGTGLGLSVSYGIIKSLGGEILVDSVPGQGSSFTISLPIR